MNDFQIEIMLAGLASEHPDIVSIGRQLIGMYQAKAGAIQQAANEYNIAAKKITVTGLEQAAEEIGIVMQLLKLNPSFVPTLCQALDLIAPHIPELKQTLLELQTKAVQS